MEGKKEGRGRGRRKKREEEGGKKRGGTDGGREKKEVRRHDCTMVSPGCPGPVLEAGLGCVHLETVYTQSFRDASLSS